MPTFDGGDDFVWVRGPREGFWHLICLYDEAVDGNVEVDDGSEACCRVNPELNLTAKSGKIDSMGYAGPCSQNST